jgi:hypothetical protein
VEDKYDPNILDWVDVNCLRTSMYDDAQVNVLEEALPLQMNLCKIIKRKRKSQNVQVMIMWIQPSWFKLFLKFVLSIELEECDHRMSTN